MPFSVTKMKWPVMFTGHFIFQRRREFNFITHLKKILDATPTSGTRFGNVFHEPFLI